MNKPDFATLTPLLGHPELRQVAGAWIDREEYDVCGWHVDREYRTDDGKPARYWKATLDGLLRYGALVTTRKAQSKAAAITRGERDDEFTRYVEALDDAKPGGR